MAATNADFRTSDTINMKWTTENDSKLIDKHNGDVMQIVKNKEMQLYRDRNQQNIVGFALGASVDRLRLELFSY